MFREGGRVFVWTGVYMYMYYFSFKLSIDFCQGCVNSKAHSVNALPTTHAQTLVCSLCCVPVSATRKSSLTQHSNTGKTPKPCWCEASYMYMYTHSSCFCLSATIHKELFQALLPANNYTAAQARETGFAFLPD